MTIALAKASKTCWSNAQTWGNASSLTDTVPATELDTTVAVPVTQWLCFTQVREWTQALHFLPQHSGSVRWRRAFGLDRHHLCFHDNDCYLGCLKFSGFIILHQLSWRRRQALRAHGTLFLRPALMAASFEVGCILFWSVGSLCWSWAVLLLVMSECQICCSLLRCNTWNVFSVTSYQRSSVSIVQLVSCSN